MLLEIHNKVVGFPRTCSAASVPEPPALPLPPTSRAARPDVSPVPSRVQRGPSCPLSSPLFCSSQRRRRED